MCRAEKSVGKAILTLRGTRRNDTLRASALALRLRRLSFIRQQAAVVSYLVDPASSHMLVLKTKPCKSKYKRLYSETADGSLKQLSFI